MGHFDCRGMRPIRANGLRPSKGCPVKSPKRVQTDENNVPEQTLLYTYRIQGNSKYLDVLLRRRTMYYRQVREWALRALCISLLAFAAFAQSERGTITGVVHDSSGAIVPGATVTIINQSTNVNLTAATNEAGEYTMPSLPPGTYTVKVNKSGFRTSEETGLMLDASQTVRADFALEVGAATQTVEVVASA